MDILSLLVGALIALIAPLITGYFNIFVKKKEFENEYFKQIVSKRLEAYEELNKLIYILKGSVQDNDGKAYHLIFQDEKNFMDFYALLYNNRINSFWFSENLNQYMLKLFNELGKCSAKKQCNKLLYTEIGKSVYKDLAMLRDNLEKEQVLDLPNLYDIKHFLKNKKVITSFVKRDIYGNYYDE